MAKQVRSPTARRSSTRSARSRRAPTAPRLRDRRRLRPDRAPDPRAAAYRPDQGLVDAARVQRARPRGDRRRRLGLPGRRPRRRPTGNSDHVPTGDPVDYDGRPAGLRPALERGRRRAGAVRRGSSTPPTTARSSSRWCTTSSTATRSSGTTRPSPTTPTRSTRSRASPTSSTERRQLPPTSSSPRPGRPTTRRQGVPGRPAHRVHALVRRRQRRDRRHKQEGVWQYCSEPSGEALDGLHEGLPLHRLAGARRGRCDERPASGRLTVRSARPALLEARLDDLLDLLRPGRGW